MNSPNFCRSFYLQSFPLYSFTLLLYHTAPRGHGSIFDTFLVEYLRDRYIETRYIPEGKEWPPNQPKYYVNLAVIHYQGSQTQEEVIFRTQQHKNTGLVIDDKFSFSNVSNQRSKILNRLKVSREIADLFTTNPDKNETKSGVNSGNFPKSILIEGAPGIGKTILLKEIAYHWANGTILDNARILFLIYVRDSGFRSVTTINELLQYFDCLEENEIPAVVKRLKQSNGERVVFLIDGLDEYPDALQNNFLVCLIDRKILSKCLFVITSRPYASISLHNKVERRIEILGFGNEERDAYILKSLPEEKEQLEVYLRQHPMLNSLVYIPFHLTVLLFLFQQGNLPETLTEMNKSFILHTVYRHMEKHDQSTSCEVKLDTFPESVNIIYKLSKLAFQALLKNQLVFTFDEVKEICPEVDTTPGALNGFGLLQAVQHYSTKGAGTTVSFNFLHLTMQEFLASWYISHCTTEQQVELLQQSFINTQSYDDVSKWDEIDNSIARMWQMYVGIVGVNCDAWIQFTTKCNLSLSGIKDPLKYLYYFQCLLEGRSKDVHLITSPFKNNTIQIVSGLLLPYHIALLCSFLSNSTEKWKSFNFCGNYMGDVGIKLLSDFLLSYGNILVDVCTLDLSFNGLTPNSATAISNIIQGNTLQKLDLSCNELGDRTVGEISQVLKVNSTLKTLILSLNDIRVEGAKLLATALCHNHTLEHLYIDNNAIMDDGVIAVSQCFKISGSNNARSTCIKSLDLSVNSISPHSNTAITAIIQEGGLVSLSLSSNNLGESGAYEISKALQVNLTLKQLYLSNNAIGANGALSLAVALRHNHTLEQLHIKYNEIQDDGVIAISESLKTNRTLKYLNISHNSITENGAIELVTVLKYNTVIEMLTIEEKYVEILKQYSENYLFNESVGRFYRIEIHSDDPVYEYDQDIVLIRIWNTFYSQIVVQTTVS